MVFGKYHVEAWEAGVIPEKAGKLEKLEYNLFSAIPEGVELEKLELQSFFRHSTWSDLYFVAFGQYHVEAWEAGVMSEKVGKLGKVGIHCVFCNSSGGRVGKIGITRFFDFPTGLAGIFAISCGGVGGRSSARKSWKSWKSWNTLCFLQFQRG